MTRWTLREILRERIGTKQVFATRPCCGHDGVGPCISEREGLPCGVAEVPEWAPLPEDACDRAEGLRRLRIELGLGLRAAAAALGLTPVELSGIERGRLDVDDWDGLRAALRAASEASR